MCRNLENLFVGEREGSVFRHLVLRKGIGRSESHESVFGTWLSGCAGRKKAGAAMTGTGGGNDLIAETTASARGRPKATTTFDGDRERRPEIALEDRFNRARNRCGRSSEVIGVDNGRAPDWGPCAMSVLWHNGTLAAFSGAIVPMCHHSSASSSSPSSCSAGSICLIRPASLSCFMRRW